MGLEEGEVGVQGGEVWGWGRLTWVSEGVRCGTGGRVRWVSKGVRCGAGGGRDGCPRG